MDYKDENGKVNEVFDADFEHQLPVKSVLSDEEIEAEVESLCRWAAGRAGVIVVAPVLGQIALMANEVYLVKRIADLYGKKLSESAGTAFISALGGAFVGQSLVTLIPFPPLQIPIGMGVTYAVGKAANAWIKDGMPQDGEAADKYKNIFEQAKEQAKSMISIFKSNPDKDKPLGDEEKKFKF